MLITARTLRQPQWLLLLLLFECPATAVTSVPSDVTGLMHLLSQVEWVQADYSETVESTLLMHSMTTEGELEYRAPDEIRKASVLGETMTIRGDRLILSDGAASKEIAISNHAALESFVVTLRATFAGDLDGLKKQFRVEYRPTVQRWTLSLHPKEGSLSRFFAHIDISGTRAGIDRIDITEPNGDRRILKMHVRQQQPSIIE